MEQQLKIQMETKRDALFLIEQFKKAAAEALDKHTDLINEIADKGRVDPNTTRAQARIKLDKVIQLIEWVEHLFQLAGNGIEINGVPYAKAMRTREEYHPLDENLRAEADNLQNQVAEQMLQVTLKRKSAPVSVVALVVESLDILSSLTKNADIIDDTINIDKENISADSIGLDIADYAETLDMERNLITELPKLLEKVKQTEKLLDDLEIPTNPPTPSVTNLKRRRSSIFAQVSQKTMSPNTARQGLLTRLEQEAIKRSL